MRRGLTLCLKFFECGTVRNVLRPARHSRTRGDCRTLACEEFLEALRSIVPKLLGQAP